MMKTDDWVTLLREEGWKLTENGRLRVKEWLDEDEDDLEVSRMGQDKRTTKGELERARALLLDCDLRDVCGEDGLPRDLSGWTHGEVNFGKGVMVQLSGMRDVSRPSGAMAGVDSGIDAVEEEMRAVGLDGDGNGSEDEDDFDFGTGMAKASCRMLRLKLTDGKVTVVAMERVSGEIPRLALHDTPPGTKIRVSGCCAVWCGIVFLRKENVDILGGQVAELTQSWLVKKNAQEVIARGRRSIGVGSGNSDMPPPFSGLDGTGSGRVSSRVSSAHLEGGSAQRTKAFGPSRASESFGDGKLEPQLDQRMGSAPSRRNERKNTSRSKAVDSRQHSGGDRFHQKSALSIEERIKPARNPPPAHSSIATSDDSLQRLTSRQVGGERVGQGSARGRGGGGTRGARRGATRGGTRGFGLGPSQKVTRDTAPHPPSSRSPPLHPSSPHS